MEGIQSQVGTINIALKKRDDELAEHSRLISEHSKVLENLEQRVAVSQPGYPAKSTAPAFRPVEVISPAPTGRLDGEQTLPRHNIEAFSEQEKRILSVFFENSGMALSYVDIARALNKSPHTIKNELNRIRLKADLFDRTVDNDSRNRFKLKDGLRIEKYLNVAQSPI